MYHREAGEDLGLDIVFAFQTLYLVTEGDNGSNCRFLGDEKPIFGYIPHYSSPIV